MTRSERITMADGGGGLRTAELVRDVFLPALANPILSTLDDAACVLAESKDLAITTDAYVVSPLFFPGGDIGRLAVCGTVNDLAVQASDPRYLTASFVIEEGFPISDLQKIVTSMAEAAREAGVVIVAGDTKVVERSGGWGVFVTTTGIGIRRAGCDTRISNAKPGDVVIVTGTLGDHAMAVMSQREGVRFQTTTVSDVAPLNRMLMALLDELPGIHVMRDLTRGGLAAALNDIAAASQVCIRIVEERIPVHPDVEAACDLLGLDVLAAANEGKVVILCEPEDGDRVLEILRGYRYGKDAAMIGEVKAAPAGRVLAVTSLGSERVVDMPLGEDLPRIC